VKRAEGPVKGASKAPFLFQRDGWTPSHLLHRKPVMVGRDLYTGSRHDGVLPYLTLCPPPTSASRRPAGGGSNLDAHHDLFSVVGAHAVEFSKTVVAAPREDFSREETVRPSVLRRLRTDRRV
jgi:hypothetical protein